MLRSHRHTHRRESATSSHTNFKCVSGRLICCRGARATFQPVASASGVEQCEVLGPKGGAPSGSGSSVSSSGRRQVLQWGCAAAVLGAAGPGTARASAALEPAAVVTASAVNVAPGTAAAAVAASSAAVQRIDLAPGLNISRVVKGCWQLSGGHKGDRESDRTYGQAAVDDFDAFVRAGVTAFDAADHYGPAEVLIGRYLASHPQQRANTQVFSKYCVFGRRDMSGISKQAVKEAVDLSRSRLGVSSVDLMQYYWGDYDLRRYADGALYLCELQAEGAVRHVGATNFDVPRMEAMERAGARFASNQLQYSLLDRRPENGMAQYCAARGIALLPYGVLAGGFLSEKYLGVPASKVNVDTYSKGKYARVIMEAGGWEWFQSLLQTLDRVGSKHGTSISNVAARWVLERPGVAAVILGARNANHVQDYPALFSFSLDEEDRGMIDEVLARGRRPRGDCYTWERGGEF